MRAAWASKRKMVIRSFWKWVGKWLSVSASLCQCSLFKRETAGSRPRVAAERPVVARVRWREDVLSTSSGHASPCFVVFFLLLLLLGFLWNFVAERKSQTFLTVLFVFGERKNPNYWEKILSLVHWTGRVKINHPTAQHQQQDYYVTEEAESSETGQT